MHQTFYIDIDEEITSIVERLKKARASEVVVVVPKRALLIQSIVNLRLLKKEADSHGLSIMIVTQDKLGKLLVEKAGILVQNKIDDMGEDEIIDSSSQNGDKINPQYFLDEEKGISSKEKSERLEKIGTENYFDDPGDKEDYSIRQESLRKSKEVAKEPNKDLEKLVNKELVVGLTEEIRKKNTYGGIDSMRTLPRANAGKNLDVSFFPPVNTAPAVFPKVEADKISAGSDYFSEQDEKIRNFFQQQSEPSETRFPEEKNRVEHKNLSKKIKKVFFVFGLVLVVAVVSVLFYLVVPKATVYITTKTKTQSADTEVKGDANLTQIDYESGAIPARVVSVTDEISRTYPTSGNKSISNQKAHGKITIYNEYSSSPQPLVATTRFLSEDGKLFRLVGGVTVPGVDKSGTDPKPGTIEADVIADESGDSFNISPAKFTIPGFKDSGSEKYQKFYAKSESSMTGGGSGSSGESTKALSQSDIDSAKSSIIADLNSDIKDKLKQAAGDGTVVLDDAINLEEATYKISNSPGEVVDNFEIKAEMKGEAIVFNDADIKEVVSRIIARANDGKFDANKSSITLDYGKAETNRTSGYIVIKVHGIVRIMPNIDLENLKRGILGKNSDELEAYLKTYPDIEKAEVTYWPPFLSNKIPVYEKRVNVELDLSQQP